MGNILTDRLALIIDAQTGGAVTAIKKVAASSTEQATAQERAALAAAKLTASQDVLAVSAAKLQVAQAKEAGDAAATAAAQDAASAATKKAAVSKAEAAVAANQLSVANTRAAASAAELGATSGATGGFLESLGMKGGAAAGSIAAAFTKAGPLVLAVLGGKLLEDGVKNFTQLGDTLRSFQLVTGASAEQASQLVGQIKSLGVDPDVAAKGISRMAAAIGDGTTKLGQYGIEVKRNADGTTDLVGTFENLRAAYNGSADVATKDAIAKQLSLRAGTALLPLLALTTQQVNDLNAATKNRGEIFSQNDINSAHNLTVAGKELKLSMQGLETSLAKGVVPALVSLADEATKVIDLGTKLQNSGWVKFFEKAIGYGTGISGAAEAIRRLTGATNDTTTASQAAAAALSAEADAVKTVTNALVGEIDAEKSVRDAAQSVTDARQSETDAEKSLADLRAAGPVDIKAVAQATKDLASASETVTRAEESETAAVDALNKARQKATELDLAEANSKIALAGDKIGQAQAAEQQAKEKLDVLLGSGSASASEIAAAQADVKARHDEVTQAVLDQKQATVDLQTVQQKGTEQDPAVQAAEKTVRDAHQSVADAVGRRTDAEANLRDKETPDPGFADKLAKAVAAVGKAHQSVADAQDNQVVAALKLHDAQGAWNSAISGEAQALSDVKGELDALNAQGINANSYLAFINGFIGGPAAGPTPLNLSTFYSGLLGSAGQTQQATTDLTGVLHLPGRAGGGPVSAYKDYMVGEKGPEILRMGSTGGSIQPNAGASITYSPTIQVTGGTNVSQLAQEIVRAASWDLRTTVLPRIYQRQ